MASRERKLRQQQHLRRRILNAARDLFIRYGYESTSMRRIAEKIEYSPTTIYLHFKDKAELLLNVCEETFAGLVQRLHSVVSIARDPVEALKAGLRAYVEFGLANPNHYRVTMMMPHPRGVSEEDYLRPDSMGFQAFEILRQGVEMCRQAGRLKDVDVETASQLLWAGVHGVTSLLIAHPDFPWVEREKLIVSSIDALVDGLRA